MSNLTSNHLSTNGFISNQRKTPLTSLSPHSTLNTSHQQRDVTSIAYFIAGYALHHKSQRHSEQTIAFHTDRLNRFVWFLQSENYPLTLSEITPHHLRHFLVYLSEQKQGRWNSSNPLANRPMSQATIHSYAKSLRAFFRWAVEEAGLRSNPLAGIKMPALPNQWRVDAFTDAEIALLFAACDRSGTPYLCARNRAILSLLLDAGLRASELLSLRVDDIDLQAGTFQVTGKGRKARLCIIGNTTKRELWSYLAHFRLKAKTDDNALFLARDERNALTYDGLKLVFTRLKELTGITRVRVSPHTCRHTFATTAHRNGMKGVVLQAALGHSSFTTTAKYYLDVTADDLKEEHKLYGPLDHLRETLRDHRGKLPHAPEIPSADVLAREVRSTSYRAVARRYGISDTAIRKRLKKAGLIA